MTLSQRTLSAQVASVSAISEVAWARTVVGKYREDNSLVETNEISLEKSIPKDNNLLSRADLLRILKACRGYVWDDKTKTMVKRSKGMPLLAIKRNRKRLSRLFILAAYTGSRCSCVSRLTWVRNNENNQSYIDINHEPPLLYLLGPDEAPGKMKGHPVYLGRRLSCHLKIWHRADILNNREYITTGAPNKGVSFVVIRNILTDAGFPAEVHFDDIRHSVLYMLADSTVASFSIAILTGM